MKEIIIYITQFTFPNIMFTLNYMSITKSTSMTLSD